MQRCFKISCKYIRSNIVEITNSMTLTSMEFRCSGDRCRKGEQSQEHYAEAHGDTGCCACQLPVDPGLLYQIRITIEAGSATY